MNLVCLREFPAYAVSDDGTIWTRRINLGRGNYRIGNTWRPMKPTRSRSGHYVFNVCGYGKPHQRYVHRTILEAFVGPCPEGMECCHADGDPSNNKLENLRWDTRISNIRDSMRHGTHSPPPLRRKRATQV